MSLNKKCECCGEFKDFEKVEGWFKSENGLGFGSPVVCDTCMKELLLK